MAKLITNPQIKKAIKDCERDECVEIILEIAQSCHQAREFLTLKFTENHSAILEDYKKKVRYEFYPPHGGFGRLQLKNAKKAINDFKKICPNKVMVIELMLFYVECCIEFTNDYGDIDERFYCSAESVFDQVAKAINTSDISVFEMFSVRLRTCVDKTRHIGWGFHDCLKETYYEIKWVKKL